MSTGWSRFFVCFLFCLFFKSRISQDWKNLPCRVAWKWGMGVGWGGGAVGVGGGGAGGRRGGEGAGLQSQD